MADNFFKKLTEKEIQSKLYGEYTMIDFYNSGVKRNIPKEKPININKKREAVEQELGLIRHEIEDTKRAFLKIDKEKKGLDKKISDVKFSAGFEKLNIFFAGVVNYFIIFLRGMARFAFVLILILVLLFVIPTLIKNIPSNLRMDSKTKIISSQKGFTIQVAEYDRFPEANQLITNLKNKGFQASVFTAESQRGKPRYRIYVGLYQDASSASGLLERLKSEEKFSDAFIRQR